MKKLVLSQNIFDKVKKYRKFKPAKYCLEDSVVCLNWDDEEARERLLLSKYNHDFFHLANMYQPQKNPFFCGVASIVTVLNALRVNKDVIPSQEGLFFDLIEPDGNIKHIPYKLYSQKTLLNDDTDRVKHRDDIWPQNYEQEDHSKFNPGLKLQHVRDILEIYKAKTNLVVASDEIDTGINKFRDTLKGHLLDDDHFIIVNYDGQVLGADVGGHFSSVAAYHERTDSVMVLDPAAHKNPWYWVPLPHLYYAMHSKDGENFRGYIIVSD